MPVVVATRSGRRWSRGVGASRAGQLPAGDPGRAPAQRRGARHRCWGAPRVGKVLRRRGQSRRPRLPRPPVVRYERASPGELLHLDTKKLGRFWHVGKRITRDGVTRSPGAGWQHVHVAVDDHSRLAYAEVRPSDRQADALAFLDRALAWFRAQGIVVRAVMTDNGPAYSSHAWRQHCAANRRGESQMDPAAKLGLCLSLKRPSHAGSPRRGCRLRPPARQLPTSEHQPNTAQAPRRQSQPPHAGADGSAGARARPIQRRWPA